MANPTVPVHFFIVEEVLSVSDPKDKVERRMFHIVETNEGEKGYEGVAAWVTARAQQVADEQKRAFGCLDLKPGEGAADLEWHTCDKQTPIKRLLFWYRAKASSRDEATRVLKEKLVQVKKLHQALKGN